MNVRENDAWLVHCISDICMMTSLSHNRVCKILKHLKADGLVEFGHLIDGDYTRIMGSGYWRSVLGEQVVEIANG